MSDYTFHSSVSGEFNPIISDAAVAYLAAAFKRWVDAGKPDIIPPAPSESDQPGLPHGGGAASKPDQ